MTTQKFKNYENVFAIFIIFPICAFSTKTAVFKNRIPSCFFVANPFAMGYNGILLETRNLQERMF